MPGPIGLAADSANATLVTVRISVQEARRFAEACRCTGHAALPPGIRKNLARGRALPPTVLGR